MLHVNSVTHVPDYPRNQAVAVNFRDNAGRTRVYFVLHPDINERQLALLIKNLEKEYVGNDYNVSRQEFKRLVGEMLEREYGQMELKPLLRTKTKASSAEDVFIRRVAVLNRETNAYIMCEARKGSEKKQYSISLRTHLSEIQLADLREMVKAMLADTDFDSLAQVRNLLEEAAELFRDIHDINKINDGRRGKISNLANIKTSIDNAGIFYVAGPYLYTKNGTLTCLVRIMPSEKTPMK